MMTITPKRDNRCVPLILGLSLAMAGPAAALELTFPPGARETLRETEQGGRYELPIGAWAADTGVPSAILDGEVTRRAWRLSGSLTSGQVLGRLRSQLEAAGFDIIFECAARACGGFDFRFGTEVLSEPDMYVDLSDYRFLSAKAPDATRALSLLVSRDGGSVFAQLIQVGPPGQSDVSVNSTSVPEPGRVPDDLIGQLETLGHVVLTDVVFASGSSALGAGAVASLDVLADYLKANANREITLVGHTDATGSLEANVALSRKRANAARAYVVAQGVRDGQVFADGVGYLSPRASNLTEAGRDANRRVEAVLVSTK